MNGRKDDKRAEGWGNLDNARDAHYFRDDRSLCGRWLAFGGPRWESNQALGTKPSKGTCKGCWKKRAKEEGVSVSAVDGRASEGGDRG